MIDVTDPQKVKYILSTNYLIDIPDPATRVSQKVKIYYKIIWLTDPATWVSLKIKYILS